MINVAGMIVRHVPYCILGRGIKDLVENTQRMVKAVHTEPYKLVEAALVRLLLSSIQA